MSPRPAPQVLVVAGHDSSGGAGVDADEEILRQLGVTAEFVVTAYTRQDARGVHELGARGAREWLAEARAALARGPRVLKLGLLPGSEHVRAAAELLAARPAELPAVVDPILESSSGTTFLGGEGRSVLLADLLPTGPILTPNLPEAAALTGIDLAELLRSPGERVAAARVLLEAGARAVVLKGGHGEEDPVRDLLLAAGAEPVWLEHARVPGSGIRGSGCRLAAAIAAGLARGAALEESLRAATELLLERLRAAAPPD